MIINYRCRVHFIMMNTVSPNKNRFFHTNIEIRCVGRYVYVNKYTTLYVLLLLLVTLSIMFVGLVYTRYTHA